jgi:hypothetical protein
VGSHESRVRAGFFDSAVGCRNPALGTLGYTSLRNGVGIAPKRSEQGVGAGEAGGRGRESDRRRESGDAKLRRAPNKTADRTTSLVAWVE